MPIAHIEDNTDLEDNTDRGKRSTPAASARRVLVAGGTGLIGGRLTEILLGAGYQVVVLTRKARQAARRGLRYASWQPSKRQMDTSIIQEVDYIINLAGTNIGARRWTSARKRLILNSRLDSLQTLIKALQAVPDHSVKALVSASAIGWYGPDTDPLKVFSEDAPPASDFLGQVCRAWEGVLQSASLPGVRKVIVRTGLVLAPDGGALQEMKKPLNFNPALILGSGAQVQSWIHLEDICRVYQYSLEAADMQGVFNAVTPAPLTYRQLITEIGRFRHGKSLLTLRIPAVLLRLVLGEQAGLLLNGSTVSPEKLLAHGFRFRYPVLNADTLRNL